MSKRKLDNFQSNVNQYMGKYDMNFNNQQYQNQQYQNQQYQNQQYQNQQYIKNIDYQIQEPKQKRKRTTKTNLQQIKLLVDDPSFHEYSLDDLGQLSDELKVIIEKLQGHKSHIDSILGMYV